MRKSYVFGRFSPRTKSSKRVRKYSWTGSFANINNSAGRLETRTADGQYEIQLHNSDRFWTGYTRNHEFVPLPFRIATGVTVPVAGYDFGSGRVGYSFGRQRNLSGDLSVDYGTFYNGHKTTLSIATGRTNFGPQISLEPRVSVNRVELAHGIVHHESREFSRYLHHDAADVCERAHPIQLGDAFDGGQCAFPLGVSTRQ
jgi:hypothetical protein